MIGDRIMKCIILENDPDRFATNLRRDNLTQNLIWDNAKGQDVLIVQTPFGKSVVSILDEMCKSLETIGDLSDKYIEVLNGVWVCYVSAADKARNSGCPVNGEASTYTVLSCCKTQSDISIYKPQDQKMISSFFDIPLKIRVDITKDIVYQGFFKKKAVETGFYCIKFPTDLSNGYMDGSLSYVINDFEVPVTKEMISQGTIYVKATSRPEMRPKNKGLQIV